MATLGWDRPGASSATATTAEGTLTLDRAGFLRPTVLVRRSGATDPVARLSTRFAGHELAIGGGPTFWLSHVSHLVPAWRLTTATGEEVLHVEPVPEHRSLKGGAIVVNVAAGGRWTLLTTIVAWYFIVLGWFEDEAIEALAPFEGPDPPLERGDSG